MAGDRDEGLLLGRNTPVVDHYSPELLYPIPREQGRASLALPALHGADLWHAYELSWLDEAGTPQVRVGRFLIPADSPNMVESKSFKLYLNSLNSTAYASDQQAQACIVADLSAVTGAAVSLELLAADDPALAGTPLPGDCLDSQAVNAREASPDPALLAADGGAVTEALYSHLLRSLCPVTGQPDWATVWIHYSGPAIERSGLLRYIVGYRRHQEFHEQCVERMYADLMTRCRPQWLEIQAFYTRRGGLDINPYRSSRAEGRPRARLDRQ